MSTAFDRLMRGLRCRPARRQHPVDPRHEPHDRRPGPPPATDGDRTAYPGDATALPDTTYAPAPDGNPDPGEIVWTWVPYEEDHSQGKDRPVLVIGREADWLVALPLTSKDHDRDAHQERRSGREWVDIGTGDWDRRAGRARCGSTGSCGSTRPGVRREGAVLPRDRYDRVVAAARAHQR